MKATLIYTPISAAVMNVLLVAAKEKGDKSTVNALLRIADYCNRDGGIPFEWEGNEVMLQSSHSTIGGDRKDDHYVCTVDSCTCPAGESRASALNFIERVGVENAGKVVIRMCWHIQLVRVLYTLASMVPIIGEDAVDQVLVSEPVLLELASKVTA